MNVTALRDLLRKQPFEPFELVASSGDRYVVDHPENCMLMKDRVIAAFAPSGKERLPERMAFLSYLHIAAAEPVSKRRRNGRHNGNS